MSVTPDSAVSVGRGLGRGSGLVRLYVEVHEQHYEDRRVEDQTARDDPAERYMLVMVRVCNQTIRH